MEPMETEEAPEVLLYSKLGCVVRMVVDSILPHAKSGPNDHRKDAPCFTKPADRDAFNLLTLKVNPKRLPESQTLIKIKRALCFEIFILFTDVCSYKHENSRSIQIDQNPSFFE